MAFRESLPRGEGFWLADEQDTPTSACEWRYSQIFKEAIKWHEALFGLLVRLVAQCVMGHPRHFSTGWCKSKWRKLEFKCPFHCECQWPTLVQSHTLSLNYLTGLLLRWNVGEENCISRLLLLDKTMELGKKIFSGFRSNLIDLPTTHIHTEKNGALLLEHSW